MSGRRNGDDDIVRLEIAVGKLEVLYEKMAESITLLQKHQLSFKLPCQDKPDNACLPVKELKGLSAIKLQVVTLWGAAGAAVYFLISNYYRMQDINKILYQLMEKVSK